MAKAVWIFSCLRKSNQEANEVYVLLLGNDLEPACAGKRRQSDVRYAPHFYVIQSQSASNADGPGLIVKICIVQISHISVKAHAELGTASGVSEFNMHVSPVQALAQGLNRLLRPDAYLYWMISFA
jgi:hypothetical protein